MPIKPDNTPYNYRSTFFLGSFKTLPLRWIIIMNKVWSSSLSKLELITCSNQYLMINFLPHFALRQVAVKNFVYCISRLNHQVDNQIISYINLFA